MADTAKVRPSWARRKPVALGDLPAHHQLKRSLSWWHLVALGVGAIVGTGIRSHPGYADRMFSALADAGINILCITTSEIRITCLVQQDRVQEAVRVLHGAFHLEKA